MRIAPFSSDSNNDKFIVISGRSAGKVLYLFENDMALQFHVMGKARGCEGGKPTINQEDIKEWLAWDA